MFTMMLQYAVINNDNRRCVRGVAVYPLTEYHALPMVCCSQSRFTASRLLHHRISHQQQQHHHYLINTVTGACSITPLHCSILYIHFLMMQMMLD